METSQSFKATNPEILAKLLAHNDEYKAMRLLGREYADEAEFAGYNGARAVFTSNFTEQFVEFVGVSVPVDLESVVKRIEIVHPNFNTFKRGKDYQPLKKNKFNKEKTNNFELTRVSLTPAIEAVFGDPKGWVFEQPEGEKDEKAGYIRYKALNTKRTENDEFYIEINSRDVNEHVLANFEPATFPGE